MESDEEKTDTNRQSNAKRYNLTPVEKQQKVLERMLKNIDVPIQVYDPKAKRSAMKAPKEFVRNVAGSSAGAGSGDFHVYRAHRRREYGRLREMREEERKEKEANDYSEKRKMLAQQDEDRTAKRRARRQKRKQLKGSKPKDGKNTSTSSKEDDDDDDDDNDDNDNVENEEKSPLSPTQDKEEPTATN